MNRREFLRWGAVALVAGSLPEEMTAAMERARYSEWMDKPVRAKAEGTTFIARELEGKDLLSALGWEISDRPVKRLSFSGINFELEEITVRKVPDGLTYVAGRMSGVTGDRCIYTVPIGLGDIRRNEWEWLVDKEGIESTGREVLAEYAYVAARSIYLNKAYNLGAGAEFLCESMIEASIKDGSEFSYLAAIKLEEKLRKEEGYLTGYALNTGQGGFMQVPAGGACGGVTAVARMAKEAELKGLVRITQIRGHSNYPYYDLPYGGIEDSVDATAFLDLDGDSDIDFRFVNTSGRELWIKPVVSYFAERLDSPWKSTLDRKGGSPVWIALSFALTTTAPTMDDLNGIRGQLNWLMNHVDANYGGFDNQ